MAMMKQFLDNSYLFGGNAPFIEDLYESYLVNPASVPEEWRDYFDKMQVLPGNATKDVAHAPVVESFVQRAKRGEFSAPRTMRVISSRSSTQRVRRPSSSIDSTRSRRGAPKVSGNGWSFMDQAKIDSSSRQSASGMHE